MLLSRFPVLFQILKFSYSLFSLPLSQEPVSSLHYNSLYQFNLYLLYLSIHPSASPLCFPFHVLSFYVCRTLGHHMLYGSLPPLVSFPRTLTPQVSLGAHWTLEVQLSSVTMSLDRRKADLQPGHQEKSLLHPVLPLWSPQ